ncbi:MAG: acyl-CoA/acyl-ACP dehydrogenase [Bifidobacteriaceae bacterium]|nr:acyl-CoA/acyl-ACP dehydrogenase [Bifidobacteriaceae bacterium]MCI1915094.1 acyl-CoA/acyl-ACP dehydrogenase [Bifidobacteriaceae bacterium]
MDQDDEELVLDMVREFAQSDVAPEDMSIDKNRKIPDELFNKMVELDLLAMNAPEEWGGVDLSLSTVSRALEIVARANASVAVMLQGQFKTILQLRRFGNQQLWDEYKDRVHDTIFAFPMTEASGGSNPDFIQSTARKVEGGYVLNGSKVMITNGGFAQVYIPMVKNEEGAFDFFVVDSDMEGFSFTGQENFIGLTGTPIGGISLKDVFVADYHRMDPSLYKDLSIADSAHGDARVLMGAVLAGIQQHALDEVLKFTQQRKAGEQYLWQLQSIQRKIADISIGYQNTRLLYQDAAAKRDAGDSSYFLTATMAKAYGSRQAVSGGDDAMQAIGALGYSADFPIAHLIRDARAMEFAEGSVEKMRTEITKWEVKNG